MAANQTGAKICWGAAWHIDDIATWDGTMEQAMNAYIDLRRSAGRRPFIDGPYFQLQKDNPMESAKKLKKISKENIRDKAEKEKEAKEEKKKMSLKQNLKS